MNWFKQQKKQGWVGLSHTELHVSVVGLTQQSGQKPKVLFAQIEQMDVRSEPRLKQLVNKLKLKSMPCNVMLDVQDYQITQIEKPNIPQEEIKTSLRWKVKDIIDYPINDAVVDGLNVPADPNNPNRLAHMLVICAKNSVVKSLTQPMLEAGVNVKAVDVRVLAQRNIAKLLEFEDRALAMLSVTPSGCLLTLTAKGELFHSRLIEMDKNLLTDASAIDWANVERLSLELQRSLDGFDRQYPYVVVNRVVVAPFAHRDALVSALSNAVYVPVNTFNLEDIVDFSDAEDISSLEKQAMLMPALGAALREEVAA